MARIQDFNFSVDLLRAVLWQYDTAPNLQSLLTAKQRWYLERHTTFWSDWVRDVFDLRTANDFGLSVWAVILGIPLEVNVGGPNPNKPTFGFGGNKTVNLTTPTRFAGGNGTRTVFDLPVATVSGTPELYVEDWQGLQPLYSTPRTNDAQYSQDFTPTFWTKSALTASARAALAPDGTMTANMLTESTTNNTHELRRAFGRPGGTTWTWSIFLKEASRRFAVVQIGSFGSQVAGNSVVVDLRTGEFSAPDPARLTVEYYGDGWWRVSTTSTLNDSPTSLTVTPQVLPKLAFGGSVTYQGDGRSGLLAWGAQFEQGDKPTPYIPVPANVSVTRTDYTRAGRVVTLAVPPENGAAVLWAGQGVTAPNTWRNFGHGTFGYLGSSSIGLTTEQKRLVLRLRYFQLISRGTVPETNRFLKMLFADEGPVYMLDANDMTFALYVFTFTPNSQLQFILEKYDLLPRPAGIGVQYIVVTRPVWGLGEYNKNFNHGTFAETR